MRLIGRRSNSGINTVEAILLSGFIAIFAMAALPRFGDSRLFSDIARAKRAMASIAVGMEAYRLDNTGYPAGMNRSPLPPTYPRDEMDQRLLTTPVSYLDQIPRDVFGPIGVPIGGVYRTYAVSYTPSLAPPFYRRSYSVYPKTSWMTWSFGPDRLTNTGGYFPLPRIIQNEAETRYSGPAIGTDRRGNYIGTLGYNGMRYDPTNGEISWGDLYHFSSEALIRLN